MMTPTDDMPDMEPAEGDAQEEVVIDDAFVASVLDEQSGDVAAVIEWLQGQAEEAREARLRALAELRNNQRRAHENEGRVGRAVTAATVRRMLTVLDQLDLALDHRSH